MKRLTYLIMVLLLAVADVSYAASDIQKAYDKAANLNAQQEYLAAAEAFHRVQEMAVQAGDDDWYLRSTVAEGECYYMLDVVTQLKEQLDQAEAIYAEKGAAQEMRVQLEWREMISKLRGSYFYCIADSDSKAYEKAQKAYQRCFDLLDSMKAIDPVFDVPQMEMTIHRELVSLHYKKKKYYSAWKEAMEVMNYYGNMDFVQHRSRQILDAYLCLAMTSARIYEFEEAEELLNDLPPAYQKSPDVLRTKGKILMLKHNFDGSVTKDAAKPYYESYLKAKKASVKNAMSQMSESQAEQYWLSLHDFLFDCFRLEETAPEMLYNLALYSKGFLLSYKQKSNKEITWTDVRSHLKSDACAIEFVQYHGKDERNQLGALVISPRISNPVFVHIADLDNLSQMRLSGYITLDQALRSTNKYDKNSIYQNRRLPQLIWTDELMRVIGDAKTIYFAPDGLLQQLAIEYIMPDSTKTCRRLSSTRVLTQPHKKVNTKRIMMIGDVDYATGVSVTTQGNDAYAYHFVQPYAASLVELPGSRKEIEQFTDYRNHPKDCILTQSEATDSAFCANAPNYPLIMIDTHGFFLGTLETGTDMKPLYMDHSMSQSGIALSGSQYALRDQMHNSQTADGILSAKEIAQLNLSCDLMVLSACQTGLGYITSDGVYGLQRGLKQAGVQAMVVSLWSVSDEATSVLMTYFYRNLCDGIDVYDAFMNARQQLKNEETLMFDPRALRYRRVKQYDSPQYTDAFILIDVL